MSSEEMARHDKQRLSGEHKRTVRYNHRFARFAPRQFLAIHMSVGVLNEWLTQMAYFTMAELAHDPVVRSALQAIGRQEAKHAGFYRRQAATLLASSWSSRLLVRQYMTTGRWVPVGGALHDRSDAAAFHQLLSSHSAFADRAARTDEKFQALAGMQGLTPIQDSLVTLAEVAAGPSPVVDRPIAKV